MDQNEYPNDDDLKKYLNDNSSKYNIYLRKKWNQTKIYKINLAKKLNSTITELSNQKRMNIEELFYSLQTKEDGKKIYPSLRKIVTIEKIRANDKQCLELLSDDVLDDLAIFLNVHANLYPETTVDDIFGMKRNEKILILWTFLRISWDIHPYKFDIYSIFQ